MVFVCYFGWFEFVGGLFVYVCLMIVIVCVDVLLV